MTKRFKGSCCSGEAVHITMVLQVVEQEEVQQVQIVALLGRGVVLPVDRRRRQELAHVLRVVRLLVRLQNRRTGERLAAHAATERSLTCVHPTVVFHVVPQLERLAAELALERPVTGVHGQVRDQRRHVREALAAELTQHHVALVGPGTPGSPKGISGRGSSGHGGGEFQLHWRWGTIWGLQDLVQGTWAATSVMATGSGSGTTAKGIVRGAECRRRWRPGHEGCGRRCCCCLGRLLVLGLLGQFVVLLLQQGQMRRMDQVGRFPVLECLQRVRQDVPG